jgi:ATP-dependent Lhr-like helicase
MSWSRALIALVNDGRLKTVEIRKVNGDGLMGAAVPDGLVESLRTVGFADGYRGLIARG